MRVLIVHNVYQQSGGEDSVFRSEAMLLRQHGHEVEEFTRHNDAIAGMNRAALALRTVWSSEAGEALRTAVARFRPDVVHAHNTFPLISPAAYWAVHSLGIPVVQTLHNFRLLCPQAMLLRNGTVCEDCVGHFPWRGVMRACYRESLPQTAVHAMMLGTHRVMRTYRDKVTLYVALNDFCRDVFVRGGLPADRVRVKPNFVEPPQERNPGDGAGFLYVGRLSREKGIATLAGALALAGVTCEAIGSGPEEGVLAEAPGVTMAGWRDGTYVAQRMARVRALVMPSLWYENFPRTLVEAFASGLPVIASRLGAMGTLIRDGATGVLFNPGDATDLAAKLRWAAGHPDEMAAMGRNALREYEERYTPEANHRILLDIYGEAIERKRRDG